MINLLQLVNVLTCVTSGETDAEWQRCLKLIDRIIILSLHRNVCRSLPAEPRPPRWLFSCMSPPFHRRPLWELPETYNRCSSEAIILQDELDVLNVIISLGMLKQNVYIVKRRAALCFLVSETMSINIYSILKTTKRTNYLLKTC